MCVVGELWNQAFRRKNRTEEKSVQWWSRHVNYDCLRKFSDRNLSVCLNPKFIPTFKMPTRIYLVNSKFYNLNFCRGPNVSTKPVTKFLQNGFRILYCLIRYSFTLGEKWQPLNIEISWVFFKWKWNESNSIGMNLSFVNHFVNNWSVW